MRNLFADDPATLAAWETPAASNALRARAKRRRLHRQRNRRGIKKLQEQSLSLSFVFPSNAMGRTSSVPKKFLPKAFCSESARTLVCEKHFPIQ